jgi:hypothetical protein
MPVNLPEEARWHNRLCLRVQANALIDTECGMFRPRAHASGKFLTPDNVTFPAVRNWDTHSMSKGVELVTV